MNKEKNILRGRRLAFALLLAWSVFYGCSEGEPVIPDPLPVVVGYLAPGHPAQVLITREISYGSTDTLTAISGLSPTITYDGQPYVLAETSPGHYQSADLPLVAGQTYRLAFTYHGREITAETEIPSSPGGFTGSATSLVVPNIGSGSGFEMPDPIQYTWDNPRADYHLLVVRNVEHNPSPITFDIGGSPIEKPEPAFRLPPHRGDRQQVTLSRFSYYGEHEVVLYRIQPEYAALYEQTSNNSTDLAAPPTNIVGGLGIFTGIHPTDTLHIHVR